MTTIPTGYADACIRLPGPSAASAEACITLGLRLVAGPTASTTVEQTAAGMAKRVASTFGVAWTASAISSWRFDSVKVLFRSGANLYEGLAPGTGAGPASATAFPPQVALVVSKRTGIVGRQYRGRWFIPGVMTEATANDQGLLPTSAVTFYNNLWAVFLTSLATAATATEAQVEAYLLHGPPKTGVEPDPTRIMSMITSPTVGTQRGRLR